MKVRVQCIMNFYDMEEEERKVNSLFIPYDEPEKHPNRNTWITTRERADELVAKGKVKIIEVLPEVKTENKKISTKKVEKRK